MRYLKVSMIGLVLSLSIFFGLERLDFGQENAVNIQTFVYPLGVMVVISIIAAPYFIRIPFIPALLTCLSLFLVLKLFIFDDRPWIGGIYTFVTFTEMVMLGGLTGLAIFIRKNLQKYMDAVEYVTLAQGSARVPRLDQAGDLINGEMNRSRHYNRSLSIILASMDTDGMAASLPDMVVEAQEKVMRQYLTARLADLIRSELRRMDMVIEDPAHNRVIIISPELDGHGSGMMLERLNVVVGKKLGIRIKSGAATYPQMALTFEDLMREAEKGMHLPSTFRLEENSGVAD